MLYLDPPYLGWHNSAYETYSKKLWWNFKIIDNAGMYIKFCKFGSPKIW